MARIHAANTTTYAETLWGAPGSFGVDAGGPLASGYLLPRFAILAGGICVLALSAFMFMLANVAYEQALADASIDLDIFARAVWRDLDAALAGKTTDRRTAPSLPDYASARGRRLLLADASGRIVAAAPPLERASTLADLFGPQQLLTEFADKAGVMRVALADGTLALATVRNLSGGAGQAAMIHPLDAVLGEWRAAVWRYAVLSAAAIVASALVVTGYYRQARRASLAERANARIRRRIDAALSRGHCGLWDWDIARGRIYWSDSMYELLGLDVERRCISFGELEARMHPQDGDLAAVVETIAASRSKSMDHEFRLRNAGGEWIWLRMRAELADDESGFGRRLIGIAVDISEQKALAEGAATA
ncbi:MAG: PAS domain-containing sensor histidine kinase, partial [Methylocystaceae bacterium]